MRNHHQHKTKRALIHTGDKHGRSFFFSLFSEINLEMLLASVEGLWTDMGASEGSGLWSAREEREKTRYNVRGVSI